MADPFNISLNLENALYDTNSGYTLQAVPGADWGYLGTVATYVIKVAGFYQFSLSIPTSVIGAPANTLMASEVGIAHMTSTGGRPNGLFTECFGSTYLFPKTTPASAPSADAGEHVGLTASFADQCSVGDIIVPYWNDLNPAAGPATYWGNPSSGSASFSGFLIGG